MKFDDFIAKYTNRGIDFDGAYGNQCMDLMHQYVVEVLGLTNGKILAAPAAKDVYEKFDSMVGREYFEKIGNTPTGVPQKGDILLWGTGIGPYGHVAVFISGDANKFKSFDQNFPTGSVCHVQDHTYSGVLGWLRPKVASGTMQVDEKVFATLVNKSTERDAIRGYLSVPLDPLDDQATKIKEVIEGYKNLATGLQRQLAEAQTKLQNKIDELERVQQTADASAKTLQARIDALQEAEKAWVKEKGVLEGLIDQHATAEGNAKIEVTEWKTKYEQALANNTAALTIGDVLRLLFKKISPIKLS